MPNVPHASPVGAAGPTPDADPPVGELLAADPLATEPVEDDVDACIEEPLDPTYLERISKEAE